MTRLLPALCAVLFLSCSEDFSPNGVYTPKLIVYSVLDGANDTQYVRVYSSFSPQAYDPNGSSPNTEIIGATVRVADDSSEFLFRDTVLAVPSGSGTRTVRVYHHPAFRMKERKRYTLTVQSPNYPVATSVSDGLESAQIFIFDTKPLFEPAPGKMITFDMYLGRNIGAYLATLTMRFEVFHNGAWELRSKEVPIDIVLDGNGMVVQRYYPIPQLYQAVNPLNRHIQIQYTTEVYQSTASQIKGEYPAEVDAKLLRFKDVKITLVQFDNEIFTYYSVANNFPGATTIRLDEPDYSNIINGFGVFGSIFTQSKTYGIPSNL